MIRILLAYSDEEARKSLGDYLVINGFEVEKAGTSEEAFGFLRGERAYDLFICGQDLTPDKGIDLCQNIRKTEGTPLGAMKILFVSQEKPDFELSKKLIKYDIYHISLYRRFSIWLETIDIMLSGNKSDADGSDKP